MSSFCTTMPNHTQASGQGRQPLHLGGQLYCILYTHQIFVWCFPFSYIDRQVFIFLKRLENLVYPTIHPLLKREEMDSSISKGHKHKAKYKQPHQEFKFGLPSPFPIIMTIMPFMLPSSSKKEEESHSVLANVLDCNIIANKFKF